MKRKLIKISNVFFFFLFFYGIQTFAQIPAGGGSYTIDTTGSNTFSGGSTGNFKSFCRAIAALNATSAGFISASVVFNVAPVPAGSGSYYREPQLVINYVNTNVNHPPILFKNSSATHSAIMPASSGTGTGEYDSPSCTVGWSGSLDGIVTISGTDYITFDGIDLQEITSSPASIAAQYEYGYGLVKKSGTDGCQYDTIKNCSISLSTTYMGRNHSGYCTGYSIPNDQFPCAIYMDNNTISNLAQLTVTSASGSNSFNSFYGNTITNVWSGIVINGYNDSSPYTYSDQNNQIGVGSANTITNTGISSGSGCCGSSACVYGLYQNNFKVANNNLNPIEYDISGSGSRSCGVNVDQGTGNTDVYNNIVIPTFTTSAIGTIGIVPITSTSSGNVNIYGNTIKNLTWPGLSGTTATFTAIWNLGGTTVNIYNNTITNNLIPSLGTTLTVQQFRAIYNNSAPSTALNIYGNTISGNSGYRLYGINCGATPAICNIYNNVISNFTIYGGIQNAGIFISGTSTPTVYNNLIHDLTSNNTAIIGYQSTNPTGSENVYNNTIYNISNTANNAATGINIAGSNSGNYYKNSIYNISTTGTGAATGINNTNGAPHNIYQDTIYNLSSAGGTVSGISCSGGTTIGIYQNKIYNLSSTATTGTSYGMNITGGTTVTVYNNMMAGLTAPAANTDGAVTGLSLNGGTTVNAYYNSIYLNTSSSGNPFGSTGIYTNTSPSITLIDNLVVNNSTPTGSGLSVAHRRNGTTLTNLSSSTDYNDWYAGTPSANNLIYYDGTNSDQTLASYQTQVSLREAHSITVDPGFTSTSDLHSTYMTNSLPLVSTGTVIAGITTDYDGDTRNCPEIGFDEWDDCGVPLPIELLSFDAKRDGDAMRVRCDWSTATETNNDYYAIERSQDAITFSQIGTVKGAGTISTTSNYTFYDEFPSSGWSYYRLRQVDYNGKYTYSNIATVYIGYLNITALYPSPATDNVTISITTEQNTEAITQVYNTLGQIVYKRTIELQKGKTEIKIPVSEYAAGQYLFKIILPSGDHAQKVFMK